MASGEADFVSVWRGRLAIRSAASKSVVEIVLEHQPGLQRDCACGMMRRAEIEATTRGASGSVPDRNCRVSFGETGRCRNFDGTAARGGGDLALIALSDLIALQADDTLRAVYRLVVNMNKYWTAILLLHERDS